MKKIGAVSIDHTKYYRTFFIKYKRTRNESPERQALRELIGSYMKEHPAKDSKDVNAMMREMMSVVREEPLDCELDEELGYSRYDYKNKDTQNSRNGHGKKTMHTSYGNMELDIPCDRDGDFEPQIIQKHQNTLTQDMKNKIPQHPPKILQGLN